MQQIGEILIISSNFHEEIAEISLRVARNLLRETCTVPKEMTVPGLLEIAGAMNFALESHEYDGIIVSGCVTKQDILQNEIILHECLKSTQELAIHYSMPTGFGIMMTDNTEQAAEQSKECMTNAINSCISLMQIKHEMLTRNNLNKNSSSHIYS